MRLAPIHKTAPLPKHVYGRDVLEHVRKVFDGSISNRTIDLTVVEGVEKPPKGRRNFQSMAAAGVRAVRGFNSNPTTRVMILELNTPAGGARWAALQAFRTKHLGKWPEPELMIDVADGGAAAEEWNQRGKWSRLRKVDPDKLSVTAETVPATEAMWTSPELSPGSVTSNVSRLTLIDPQLDLPRLLNMAGDYAAKFRSLSERSASEAVIARVVGAQSLGQFEEVWRAAMNQDGRVAAGQFVLKQLGVSPTPAAGKH